MLELTDKRLTASLTGSARASNSLGTAARMGLQGTALVPKKLHASKYNVIKALLPHTLKVCSA